MGPPASPRPDHHALDRHALDWHALDWTVVGWIVQTAGLAWMIAVHWQYQAGTAATAPAAGGGPAIIPYPRTAVAWGAALFLAGTVALGVGLSRAARAKGHPPWLGVLAPTWIASLLLIGLLPDFHESPDRQKLRFECPHCGSITWIDLQYAGCEGPCRVCGELIRVPGVLPAEAAGAGDDEGAQDDSAGPAAS